MRSSNTLRSMIVSAAMAALALVLPMIFHMTGLGSEFLPMILPLMLNAFLSSIGWAVLTAALLPWISALATGMPPMYPPVALAMSVEAATMALVVAAVWRLSRRRIWPTLIAGVVADRAASFLIMLALASKFALPANAIAIATFLHSLPGVALQLIAIPLTLAALRGRRSLLFGHDE